MFRSDFPEGTTRWAVRRAQWAALGISDEEMNKPKTAVVNSSNELAICFSHLDAVVERVKAGIREAGGLPFEIRTAAPSDFITSAGRSGRYLMPTRDLMVNDIEVQVEGACLDGMVLLSSCDKTTPAHLMAAGRLDIPAVVVPCGYQMGGACGGLAVDIEDVYEGVGAVVAGSLSLEALRRRCDVAISSPGVCSGLATANSMHILAEVLGMTVPGAAPIRGGSGKLLSLARDAGHQVVAAINAGRSARQVLTSDSIRNGIVTAIAMGMSTNVVRHLTAVAAEAEIDIDVVSEFDRLATGVPLIARIRPNGPTRIETLELAGGARAIITRLRELLSSAAVTVDGGSLEDRMLSAADIDSAVLATVENPMSPFPGLAIIRGNLAPAGAIVKRAAIEEKDLLYEGPANTFDREEEAIQGLSDGAIRPGDVVFLRGLGPLAGPGTVFAAGFMAALVGAGLKNQVAVVTDGEMSGLNSGLTVGQVMPEAAAGGPVSLVRDGDPIRIDLVQGRIDVLLDEEEWSDRLDTAKAADVPTDRGWLGMYRQLVRPMEEGAVLVRPKR